MNIHVDALEILRYALDDIERNCKSVLICEIRGEKNSLKICEIRGEK